MKKTVVIGTALLLVQIPLIALVLLQERTWGGPQFDEGSGVATARDNSAYVTGTTLSFGAGDRDAFLLKYNATGVLACNGRSAPHQASRSSAPMNSVALLRYRRMD